MTGPAYLREKVYSTGKAQYKRRGRSVANSIMLYVAVLLFSLLFSPSLSHAGRGDGVLGTDSHWTFLSGYGTSHKGFGETETAVKTVDVVMRYGNYLSGELGSRWYKYRHKILLEVPFSYVMEPEIGTIQGFNLLAGWDFTTPGKLKPYFFAGGGLLYTDIKGPKLGSRLNGNYQAGIGVHYFADGPYTVDVEYRWHHISNAGTASPNEPLNSSKIYLGISYLFSSPR